MPSDSARPARPHQSNNMGHPPPPPPQNEPLPCPRCDSTKTKFCYYNNYNLSQPRHFCKSCRRYWTQGGTLRDVPVGGGSRKSCSKRSRSSSSPPASSSSSSCSSASSITHEHFPGKPISVLAGFNLEIPNNVSLPENMNVTGSFTSLLSSQNSGLLALGGYGSGVAHEFDELGFGFGRGVWSYPEMGDLVSSYNSGSGAAGLPLPTLGYNGWPSNGGEGGEADVDCFTWPDLSISMQGKSLK